MVAVLSAVMVMAVAVASAMAVMKAKTHKSVCRFQTHIVPYIFSGVFAWRFNSFWSSLVACRRHRSRSCCFCHLCHCVRFIFLSIRFVSFRFSFLFFGVTASNSLASSVRVCVHGR